MAVEWAFEWGLDEHFVQEWRQAAGRGTGAALGRITSHVGRFVDVVGEKGLLTATRSRDAEVVVGDWVVFDPRRAFVTAVLPRRTLLRRQRPGRRPGWQALGANIDLVIVVTGLDEDFNLHRIQRFLTLTAESGARACVVLNKSDLCASPQTSQQLVQAAVGDVPVVRLSALERQGLATLKKHLRPKQTAVLVGSSGAGKSTLLNALSGAELARTSSVRDDGRGKHTTTRRSLYRLPSGVLIADVPGIREVGLLGDEAAIDSVFDEISALAKNCRFRDCTHHEEPGCAVVHAVESGILSADSLEHYHALKQENEGVARRANAYQRRAHERSTHGRWRRQFQRINTKHRR